MRDGAERRYLRRGNPRGANSRAAASDGRLKTRQTTKSTPAASASPSESLSFPTATIRNGFTSPIPTASSAFPTRPATSKPPASRRPSSPSCRMARAFDQGHRLHQRRQADAGLGRLRAATTPKEWQVQPADCRLDRQASARRKLGHETDRADVLAFDPDGKRPEHLRHRHPQLRRARRSSRRPAISIARPTSATASATIWCPTTSPACAKARSMAGRGSTSATMKTRGTRASGPT